MLRSESPGHRDTRAFPRLERTTGERNCPAPMADLAGLSTLDVLTIGRVGIDLYPLQDGVTLDCVDTFQRYLGGSPTNVAVAAARLGHSSAVITRTGDDPFAKFVHPELR